MQRWREAVRARLYRWSAMRIQRLYDVTLEPHQFLVYRCTRCPTLVVWTQITSGTGCSRCGSQRISPTNLSLWEELRVLFFPRSFLLRPPATDIPKVQQAATFYREQQDANGTVERVGDEAHGDDLVPGFS